MMVSDRQAHTHLLTARVAGQLVSRFGARLGCTRLGRLASSGTNAESIQGAMQGFQLWPMTLDRLANQEIHG